MASRAERREQAIERMADHLLAHGLPSASLRPLAAAAGTSDRMLLYYFVDKEEVLAATLERVAGRLVVTLDAAVPPGTRLPPDALRAALWRAVRSPELAPYMRVWLELAAAASRGTKPHAAIAQAIMAGFVAWLETRIEVDAGERDREVARLLALVEGGLFLDAVGAGALADRALA